MNPNWNKWEAEAFRRFVEAVGKHAANEAYFKAVVLPQSERHGIRLQSDRGLELFAEILIPEELRKKKAFEQRGGRRRLLHLFAEFNSALWNSHFAPDRYALGLAKIAVLGFRRNCLSQEIAAFHMSTVFIGELEKMVACLRARQWAAARNVFQDADDQFDRFSAIEILAMKYFYLSARRLVFLTETEPNIDQRLLVQEALVLSQKITEFIGNSSITEKRHKKQVIKKLDLMAFVG